MLKVSNKMPSIIKVLLSTLKYQSIFYDNMYANFILIINILLFSLCSFNGFLLLRCPNESDYLIHSSECFFIVIFGLIDFCQCILVEVGTSIWVSAQLNSASEHAALLRAAKSTQSNINILYFTFAFNASCMQRPMKRKVCLSFSCIYYFWLERRHGGGVNACKEHSEIRSKTLQHMILNEETQ